MKKSSLTPMALFFFLLAAMTASTPADALKIEVEITGDFVGGVDEVKIKAPPGTDLDM